MSLEGNIVQRYREKQWERRFALALRVSAQRRNLQRRARDFPNYPSARTTSGMTRQKEIARFNHLLRERTVEIFSLASIEARGPRNFREIVESSKCDHLGIQRHLVHVRD